MPDGRLYLFSYFESAGADFAADMAKMAADPKTQEWWTLGATRVYDVVQQLAQPEEQVLDRLRVDVVDIGRTFNTDESAWQPAVLADG